MTFADLRKKFGEQFIRETSVTRFDFAQFEKLDADISSFVEDDERKSFNEECRKALEHDLKNSVAVRYLATMTGRHTNDDIYILTVFEEYVNAKLADQAIALGNLILTFNENAYVIRSLADCYESKGDEDMKIKSWEHFVRVDHEDTDILVRLGERSSAMNEVRKALGYYRRAIKRLMNEHDLVAMKDIWQKVMSLKSDNPDYLISFASKIAEAIGYDKGVYFLHSIAEHGNFDIETNILVFKKIIEFNPHDEQAKDSLVELWRIKYKDNPRLNFCLNNTGILQNYLDIKKAIKNFEKEIEFVEGAFIWHDSWGIGRIIKINQDEMQLKFVRKGDHSMNCTMAFNSLRVLPKSHIWVLKTFVEPAKLKARFLGDVEWGIKCIIQSYGNSATLKQIKDELVPDAKDAESRRNILTPSEWTTWQTQAKKILSTNEFIGIVDGTSDTYTIRNTPISFEEKQLSKFNSERDFFTKLGLMREFMVKAPESLDSDELMQMVAFFQTKTKIDDKEGFFAFLLINELRKNLDIDQPYGADFMSRYRKCLNIIKEAYKEKEKKECNNPDRELIKSISDNDLKKDFVLAFSACCEDEKERQLTLVSLFHVFQSSFMADCITRDKKHRNDIYTIMAESMRNYKDDPDFLCYLLKAYSAKDWMKAGFDAQALLIGKLQLLLYVVNMIENNTSETAEYKKIQKQLDAVLFDEPAREIEKMLKVSDADQARKIFSLVNGLPGYVSQVLTVKHFILTNFPNGEDITRNASTKPVVEQVRMVPKGLLCTRKMKEAKIAELDHIMNVEIPENSKDIGTARELGDLRENAEYQYAKDKQKNLNFMMNSISDELDKCQVKEPSDIDTSYVCFGTKVQFHDNKADKDISMVVLGPWESNPEKNILNFQSPLGNAVYYMTVGETKDFEINGIKYSYTVKSIELADF